MNKIIPILLRLLLRPFAAVYELIVRLRNWLYACGWMKVYKAPIPVISIGNITLGGTGKTPLTINIAKRLIAEGKKVAILSRGYRRKSSGIVVVSNGNELLCSVEQAGDEPYLIAQSVPKAVVIVAARRVNAARMAIDNFRPDMILLDDGFQHRAMGRSCDVVLVDCEHELLKDCMFPAGSLREPISELKRANEIVFTNAPDDPNGDRNYLKTLSSTITQLAPNATLSQCSFIPSKLVPVLKESTNPALNISELHDKRAVAFCGIAKPHRFFNQLRKLGLRIVVEQNYPDHYWYRQADVLEIKRQLEDSGSNLIVTTAKDAVRLQAISGMSQELAGLPLWYLDIDVKYDSYH